MFFFVVCSTESKIFRNLFVLKHEIFPSHPIKVRYFSWIADFLFFFCFVSTLCWFSIPSACRACASLWLLQDKRKWKITLRNQYNIPLMYTEAEIYNLVTQTFTHAHGLHGVLLMGEKRRAVRRLAIENAFFKEHDRYFLVYSIHSFGLSKSSFTDRILRSQQNNPPSYDSLALLLYIA